jgi:hypothetical protein
MGRYGPPRHISPNTLAFLSNFLSTNFSTFINRHIIRRYMVSTLIASLNKELKKEISVIDTETHGVAVYEGQR